jgi:hypothetical protein
MRFQLSTLLLAMLIVALGLGWYLDHNDPRRTEIVGTWRGIHNGKGGISTTLEIKEDGTFNQVQRDLVQTETYEGTYFYAPSGVVTFHIKVKNMKLITDDLYKRVAKENNLPDPTVREPLRLSVPCDTRCAVDRTGVLVISVVDCRSDDPNDKYCNLKWETYKRVQDQ